MIPRHVLGLNTVSIQLHGFCDASNVGYRACIYVVSKSYTGLIDSTLLYAKSKVAPLKSVTTPRPELCGAHLVSKSASYCLKAINLDISNIYLWSDSTVVLGWVKTPSNVLKMFVAYRVSDIQILT